MAAVECSLMDSRDELEGRHHRARREDVDFEATASHLLSLLSPVDEDFMEDVLRGSGALHLEGDRGLCRCA
jgi:hypothetical protein